MFDIFSDDTRRNPYPAYDHLRRNSPVMHVPPPFNGWLVFDYEGVKRVLSDAETFSSRVPAPRNWFIFFDAPQHTRQRALISKAFTPRTVTSLEPRIRELSRELLDPVMDRREFDLATEYAVPLPMKVIAGLIGIPLSDWEVYKRWSDAILKLTYTRSGGPEAEAGMRDFRTATAEMSAHVAEMIAARRAAPRDDLLTRLVEAEVEGERLSHDEILGFFQLLVVGGQETTSDLINNAMLSLMEHPDQMALLRAEPHRLGSAIEEVLRYRSPLQWVMRTPRRDVDMHGVTIPAGALVLPMIGSANRDPRVFPEPSRFDIARDPNPHVAFGQGAHFCAGAPLSRLEARIALTDLLHRFAAVEQTGSAPWPPRKALHVHGPDRLPVRVQLRDASAGAAG
jgi:cytochrome P450